MMNKKLLNAALALGLLAGAAAPALADEHNEYYEPYIIQRNLLNLGSTTSGSFDMSRVRTAYPPVKMRLHMENESDTNVNVRIPDLELSFMVPGRTTREWDLSLLAAGRHNEVAYTVEPLVGSNYQYVSKYDAELQRILSPSYIQTIPPYVQSDEGRRTAPSYSAPVRGYW